MLWIDWLVCAALGVAVIAWWMTDLRSRRSIIALASLVVLLTGFLAIMIYRWQAAGAMIVAVLLLACVLVSKLRAGKRPLRVPYFSGSFFSVLALASFGLLFSFIVTSLPAPSGEHSVGVRDFELADQTRQGVLRAEEHEPRRLLVRVWYPAGDIEGLSPRRYFNDLEAETTAGGLGSSLGMPFLFRYMAHSSTNSYEGAPLFEAAANQPVVIYSHGYTSFLSQNTALMEELASHGYIVYSVQHTYDASPTVFPNGDVAELDPAIFEEAQAMQKEFPEDMIAAFTGETFDDRRRATQSIYKRSLEEGQRIASLSAPIWLADRIFVHDQLEAGAVPDSVFEIVAASDLRSVGEIGMSFGGSTTGGVCMVDPRCAAGINLDGGDYDFSPFNRNIPVPFLMFYSDVDMVAAVLSGDPKAIGHGFNDFSYERHETAGLRQDVYRLKVENVAHLGVSDFPLFARAPFKNILLGSIDADAIIQIQNDFVRGFFDRHLRDLDNDFPESEFAKHAEHVQPDTLDDLREWWLEANPMDRTVQVVLETSAGEIEIALYPERAPLSVAQFLAYVDGGHYDGASLYRVTQQVEGGSIGIVQGGLLAYAMSSSSASDEYAQAEFPLSPVAHEPTDASGILNERGTIAYARLEPGSANSEFFFNVQDNPVLDTGYEIESLDGYGYATFGRVLRGLRILEKIQQMPSDAPTPIEIVQGQILEEPVEIRRAYRVMPAS